MKAISLFAGIGGFDLAMARVHGSDEYERLLAEALAVQP